MSEAASEPGLTMRNLLTMYDLLTMHNLHSSIFNSPTKNLFNYIICIYSGVTGSLIIRLLLGYTKAKLTFKICIDFHVFYTVTVNIEWLSNDCQNTMQYQNHSPTNQTRSCKLQQHDKPIRIPSNFTPFPPPPPPKKRTKYKNKQCTRCDWFRLCFSLVQKLSQV